MTKQKSLRRTSVLVVAILLITMSFLCVTLAKYTTTIQGTGNATLADWVITANDKTDSFTVDLVNDRTNDAIDGTMLAPGAKGVITVNVKNESDVPALYTVKIETTTGPKALHYYTDANCTMAYDTENGITGDLAFSETDEVKIYWKWDFNEAGNDDNSWTSEATDTFKATITVSAEQSETNVTAAVSD